MDVGRYLSSCLALALGACGPKAMTISVKQPSSLVVSYVSGHTLGSPSLYPEVEVRTAAGAVVPPAEARQAQVETRYTTKYYVLPAGTYRLVNHHRPTIKVLRRRPTRSLTSESVTSELDASTDANDERGRTTEAWRSVAHDTRPYFVLLTEHAPDSLDDFWVQLLDEEGRPFAREHGSDSILIGGAAWIGPVSGPVTIQALTYGTIARRYSLRIAQPPEETFEPRTAPVGTTVRGTLGPGNSNYANGWVDTVTFTSEREQPLFATLSWTPDSEHLQSPWISTFDDAGLPVEMTQLLRRDAGQVVATAVFRTKRPHRGAMHVRIMSPTSILTSGHYTVCVTPDVASCDDDPSGSRPLRRW